jgi:hypothetical protein
MIITATRRKTEVQLKLTKTKLQEEDRGDIGMYVTLPEIKRAANHGFTDVYSHWVEKEEYDLGMYLPFDMQERRIGCCSFDLKNFNKILKAAKVKTLKGDGK